MGRAKGNGEDFPPKFSEEASFPVFARSLHPDDPLRPNAPRTSSVGSEGNNVAREHASAKLLDGLPDFIGRW